MLHIKYQTCVMFKYFAVEFHFKFFLKNEISDKDAASSYRFLYAM